MTRQSICLALLICLAATLSINTYASDVINQEAGKLDAEGKLVWYEAKLFGVEGKGWVDTESYYDRLPLKAKGMVRKPVWNLSHYTAGMLIRFATDAKAIRVRWTLTKKNLAMKHMPATGVSGIDLYYRDKTGKLRFCGNGRPKKTSNETSLKLPPSDEYVLYLPLYNGIKQIDFGIPKGKTLSKFPPPSPSRSVVFYGTSITQGGCASRPGMCATSILLVEDSSIKNLPTRKGDILRKIHAKLTAEGDKNLKLLSNIGMLGEDREATVDGCHLTDLGMSRQAAAFIKSLEPILKKQKSNNTDAGDGK